jgi:hypothetical protein
MHFWVSAARVSLAGRAPAHFETSGCAVAEEDGHELVHAGVGEEQAGRVGQQRRRRHDRVAVRGEEIEERLADFMSGAFFAT